jgi:hypothetical protein
MFEHFPMTDQPNALVRKALNELNGKHLPATIAEAFAIATVLDMGSRAYAVTTPAVCESLRAGLKAFLFKNLGTPAAFLLAESSWAAADLAEAIACETEDLFAHQWVCSA